MESSALPADGDRLVPAHSLRKSPLLPVEYARVSETTDVEPGGVRYATQAEIDNGEAVAFQTGDGKIVYLYNDAERLADAATAYVSGDHDALRGVGLAPAKTKRSGVTGKLINAAVWIGLLLSKLKLFTTAGTMLVSVGAYTLIFGLPFAVGFVLLILVHEYGHVIQLRREGIDASAPMFIPFLGAAIAMKEMPKDAISEARVGLAGPVLGVIGCVPVLIIGLSTGSEFWLSLAATGFLINLFNLLPIVPLDGGRAAAALSPWLWIPGAIGISALALLLSSPLVLIIALVCFYSAYSRFRDRNKPEVRAYYEAVKPRHRVAIAGVYLALLVATIGGMSATYIPHHDLKSNDSAQVR